MARSPRYHVSSYPYSFIVAFNCLVLMTVLSSFLGAPAVAGTPFFDRPPSSFAAVMIPASPPSSCSLLSADGRRNRFLVFWDRRSNLSSLIFYLLLEANGLSRCPIIFFFCFSFFVFSRPRFPGGVCLVCCVSLFFCCIRFVFVPVVLEF